jgi:hypothetical protein
MRVGVAQGLDFAHTTEVAILSGEWNRDYTLMSQNATAFPGSREKIVPLPLASKLAPQHRAVLLFLIRRLRAPTGEHRSVPLRFVWGFIVLARRTRTRGLRAASEVVFVKRNLERDNPVNAIRAEDAELPLVIAAKIDKTTAALASAGQRHLVDRSDALPVFIFKQHDRLARHRCRQAEIRKCNHVTGY